ADFKAISKLDEKKRREDGMRLFYVGCTRAEERLVLSGCYMARKSVGIAAKADALAQNEPNLFCKGEPLTPASFASQDFLTPYDVLSKEPSDGAEGKSDASPEQKRAPSVVKGYVSVGDLTTFSRCKRKYLFNNLMKIPAPIIKTTAKKSSLLPPAEFGSVAHSIIEDADMEASHTAFKKFVRKESAERLSHYPPSDRNAVARCVLNVLEFDVIKKLREGRLKLVGREIPFACKFDDGSIMEGKIDLLLRDEKGNPVVADYKFSLKQLSLSTVEITNFERQCRDDKMTSTFAGSDGLKCPDPTCAYSAYCHAAVKL
ncbi:MAG: PD-(D/E)XK nuclease family protein, partial [Nitrospinae bacterium]|nr:PD-(D/E)XK nuclease family protein [Nitrospinota bacterium]